MNNDPKLKTKAEKDRRLKEKQAANTKKIIDERKSKGMKENKVGWLETYREHGKRKSGSQLHIIHISGAYEAAKRTQEGVGGSEQMDQGLVIKKQQISGLI